MSSCLSCCFPSKKTKAQDLVAKRRKGDKAQVHGEITNLHGEVSNPLIAALEDELARERNEVSNLKEEVVRLETALAKSQCTVYECRESLQDYKAAVEVAAAAKVVDDEKISSLESLVKHANEEIERLKLALADMTTTSEQRLLELEQQIQQGSEQLVVHGEEAAQLAEAAAAAIDQIKTLEENIQTMQIELTATAIALNEAKSAQTTTEQEVHTLEEVLSVSRGHASELEKQLVVCNEQIQQLELAHHVSNGIQTTTAALEIEINELKSRCQELHTSHRQEINTLMKEMEILQKTNQQETEVAVGLRQQLLHILAAKEKTERTVLDLQSQIHHQQTKTTTIQLQNKELSTQLAAAERTIKTLQTQITSLTSLKEEAHKRIEALEQQTIAHQDVIVQKEAEFASSLQKKKIADELDSKRVADLQEVNDRLRSFARDRSFQEALKRPNVMLALECWRGANMSHLTAEEMENIKNDEGVQLIYQPLKEFEETCDLFAIRFPIDHLLEGKTELSAEAVAYAYGPDFIALHHLDFEAVQGKIDYIPVARPHSLTLSTPTRSRSATGDTEGTAGPDGGTGGSETDGGSDGGSGEKRSRLMRKKSFTYVTYKLEEVNVSPERTDVVVRPQLLPNSSSNGTDYLSSIPTYGKYSPTRENNDDKLI